MIMARILWEQMVHLWAISSAKLDHAAGTAIKVEFINVPFVPSLDRVLADVPAQATGLAAAAIDVFDVAPSEFTDAVNAERVVEFGLDGVPLLVEGAGGGFAGTLYGTRLVKFDDSELLATALMAQDLPFTADAQNGGEIPRVQFRFPTSMIR